MAEAFLEEVAPDLERLKTAVAAEDYHEAYQAAHKMKPTVDLFELGCFRYFNRSTRLGEVYQKGEDITPQLAIVVEAVEKTLVEIKSDFNL